MILKIKSRGKKSFQIDLVQDRFRIGRSSQNDLKLAADPALSRFHAEIRKTNTEFFVSDLDSRNGTFINGKRVQNSTRLHEGDLISVGETEIFFGNQSQPLVTLDDSSAPTDLNTTSIPLDDILHPATKPSTSRISSPARGTERHPNHLSIITKAGRELIRHRPLNEVFDLIMDLVLQAIPAERGCLMLRQGEEKQLVAKVARDTHGGSPGPISLSSTIARMVVEEKKSVVTTDAQTDHRFQGKDSIVLEGVRSAICVPLWNNREVTGLIYLDTQEFGVNFTEEDIRLLTILGNIAAVKIENDSLVQEQFKKKHMEEELRKAAEIQKGFLPFSTPSLAGLDILGFNISCEEVGGDSFDFVLRDGNRLVAAIGDVSGKGMPAALLMAHIQAAFRAWVDAGVSLPKLIQRLNQAVIRSRQDNKFISFFVTEIDPEAGKLVYCNAGHNPPYLVRAGGKVVRLTSGGLILGVLPETEFAEENLPIKKGDLILMYSDGLTESMNLKEEQFGEQRLERFLGKHHKESCKKIQENLEAELKEFCAGAPQHDDLTLVLIRKT